MKSDNAVLGWLSVNTLLQAAKSWFNVVEPYLNSALTVSQILVALATFVLIVYKVRAARKSAKYDE